MLKAFAVQLGAWVFSYAGLITIVTVTIITLQLYKHWKLSKGDLWWAYRLNVGIFTSYIILETVIALHDPAQFNLIFMNIVSLWALIMATKGIIRLKKEDKEKQHHQEIMPEIEIIIDERG